MTPRTTNVAIHYSLKILFKHQYLFTNISLLLADKSIKHWLSSCNYQGLDVDFQLPSSQFYGASVTYKLIPFIFSLQMFFIL